MKSFFQKKDLTQMSKALLHNRFVLYFVFILAIGNIFNYTFSYDLTSVGVFIAAGLLTSFFSKNMIVILVIAMVVSNIFRYGNRGSEGFKSKKDGLENSIDEAFQEVMDELENEEEEEEEDDDDDEDEDMDEEEDEDMDEEDME